MDDEKVLDAGSDNEDFEYIKMDFNLETPEERVEKVKEIISQTPPEKLTDRYVNKLSDYIIFAADKQERKKKKILTDNRMVTINKRETSYEGMTESFENGEDGIYGLIANDKNKLFKFYLSNIKCFLILQTTLLLII